MAASSSPPPPADADAFIDDRFADEQAELRALVAGIRDDTMAIARLSASLIRRRAAVMRIALARMERSGSRLSLERELPVRSVALEIGVATRTHDLTVQKELSDAHTLTEKFAATVGALEDGRITPRHAAAILETGIVLDDPAARAGWETVVLVRAERDSPGRVRAYGRELAESVQPEGMTARHLRAAAQRGVSVRDLADGMAELSVILPATVAYGIRDRLRRQAAAIRAAVTAPDTSGDSATAGDGGSSSAEDPGSMPDGIDGSATAGNREPSLASMGGSEAAGTEGTPAGNDEGSVADERTLAQIGADVLADLLLTAAPSHDPTTEDSCPGGLGAVRAQVQITVPVLTLLGRTDGGAIVDNTCPIDPATARRLAAGAPGWDRVLCDPVTGTVLEVDRYTPTSAQRRFLAARDRHCRAPGCRAPIARCQLDHNREAQDGGPTHLRNLCHLCVRHHVLKTEEPWTIQQNADGSLLFHSPLGQQTRESPPPRVMFRPTGDPPPF
ncbi:HNH endonuclease signature motif containing protein [Microbacterium sp. LMI1-1-1.1]|uniref:HNH endonuclease signature motif containing protein n=1 Tax=Microbacterium sp. LMI1-1-1.1 TaxID=3135223 RepID=UPI0034673117